MKPGLGVIDVFVLCTALFAAVAVGLWLGRSNKDVESYLLGGRDLPWWAILGSIVATETSTVTVLSVTGTGYGDTGMKFLQFAIGLIFGRAIVVKLLLPLYFQGRLSTAYEVLDRRFGAATKQAASLLFLVARNLGDGLRLFLAGLVVQELMGWPFATSIVAMGAITVVYTVFGGLKSVVWNDCIQFVIYMAGGIAAVFIVVDNIPGGWNQLWTFAAAHDKLRVFEFRWALSDAYTIWAGVIGGAVLTIGTHGTDHLMVQRYLSARSQRDAGRAVFLSAVVVFVQFALFLFIGVELACYYSTRPDIIFETTDRVFSHFIVNVFPRNIGLVGLMLAAILSAAMSTLSSSLSASASALLNDLVLPVFKTLPSTRSQLNLSRGLTVAFGGLQIGIGLLAIRLSNAVVSDALTIAGFSAGLLLGIFLLGVLTRRVGQTAALAGAAVGVLCLLTVQFVLPEYGWSVAWPWLAIIGATTTFFSGLLLSYAWPRHSDQSAV